ncbi:MAG: glycosyltransferase family 39 protein, partial [Dermatophilaceae bacterium]
MTLPRTATTEVGPPPVRSTAAASAATTSDGSLGRRLWRGPTSDPAWARPALLGLLLATTAFYLWNLTANGWANSFYSAAVQAGSDSWKAFFFGSSDAANSITVDKPPAALWIMALSVRVFGLSSFSILLPEVLMGVASVGVLYTTVKRQFGAAAGLIAGGILALTPVAVLMFRFNNPEALLTLLMTLAAWATMRSIEKSSPKWFILVGVFIGLGFLTKTLQAFLVVPGFALAYLVAAKPPLLKRIWHTVLGGLAIVVSAGWWVAIVELIPASMRPYIGGSQTNSFLELTFGYNGLGRISGDETGSVGGAGGGAGGNWGATGLGRLFNAENGGQISWLMPAALLLLVIGLVMRARAPRTDARRAAYLVWGSWFVVTLLVFSLMAGIYHAYYTIALAPAVAALVAMGAREAWERKDSAFGAISLAVAMAATSVWSFLLLSRVTTWNPWLRVVVLALGMAAAFGFLVVSRLDRRALPALVGLGLFAALLGPAAYSVQTVSVGHSGSIVTAGPSTGGMGGPGGGGMPAGAAPGGKAPGGTAPGGTARG